MEKIVGLGEILWDVFPDGAVLGGAPANFAVHVNSLGKKGIVVSSIGKDKLGKDAKDIYDSKNLEYVVSEVDYPTGTVIVKLDNEGKATYDFTKDCAWDYIDFNSEIEAIARDCSAVCFGTLGQRSEKSRSSIYKFLECTSSSCIKVFDINIRENYYSKDMIVNSLKHATVLKLNDEELPLITDMLALPKEEDEALEKLKSEFSLDLIIVTKGGDGSRLYRSKYDDSFVKPEKTKIVDTVGAGDSFTATVVVGLLNNEPLETINKRANKVAAFVCTQKGATPSLADLKL